MIEHIKDALHWAESHSVVLGGFITACGAVVGYVRRVVKRHERRLAAMDEQIAANKTQIAAAAFPELKVHIDKLDTILNGEIAKNIEEHKMCLQQHAHINKTLAEMTENIQRSSDAVVREFRSHKEEYRADTLRLHERIDNLSALTHRVAGKVGVNGHHE